MSQVTVVVPTCNEGANVRELVAQLEAGLGGWCAQVIFVDDSTDDTPDMIQQAARTSTLPVRLLHRQGPDRTGGLASAVVDGIRASTGEYVVVMDADLQHPPSLVPVLLQRLSGAELVVASRYCGDGDSSGLSSSWRHVVSTGSTMLAKACFPRRVGRVCTDPMTGFFAFQRDSVHLNRLRPRGYKILLEIMARHDLVVHEVPFIFGVRMDGESKASWKNGVDFLYQMASLRMGRMSRFAAVGALGTLVNLGVMALLIHGVIGFDYVVASIIAAEVSILHNFLMQERFVFRDMKRGLRIARASLFFGMNNVEAVVRIPILVALVEWLVVPPVLAQAALLAVAFVGRFLFTSRVIYRPRRTAVPAQGNASTMGVAA